jgi:hypothetical protein
MTAAPHHQGNLTTRQRWISLSEFVVGGAIVIAHNVYHRVPNEVPILFLLGWISIRLRDGGWQAVGLHKPDSWRETILWLLDLTASDLSQACANAVCSPDRFAKSELLY